MDPQILQQLMQMLGQQQPQQIPNAQMGQPQMPKPQMPQPVQAQTPQAQGPGMGEQTAQAGINAGITTGASMVNPALGVLAQMIMPLLLQSLFGKQKQQMPSAQVIPAPR